MHSLNTFVHTVPETWLENAQESHNLEPVLSANYQVLFTWEMPVPLLSVMPHSSWLPATVQAQSLAVSL